MSSAVAGADGGEDDGRHPIGVTLGVGRPEHRSPGDPEHDPPLDAEVLTHALDVADVVVHVHARPVARLPRWRAECSARRRAGRTARRDAVGGRSCAGTRACSPSPARRAGTRPACRRGCRPARRRGRDRRRRRGDQQRTDPAAARALFVTMPAPAGRRIRRSRSGRPAESEVPTDRAALCRLRRHLSAPSPASRSENPESIQAARRRTSISW